MLGTLPRGPGRAPQICRSGLHPHAENRIGAFGAEVPVMVISSSTYKKRIGLISHCRKSDSYHSPLYELDIFHTCPDIHSWTQLLWLHTKCTVNTEVLKRRNHFPVCSGMDSFIFMGIWMVRFRLTFSENLHSSPECTRSKRICVRQNKFIVIVVFGSLGGGIAFSAGPRVVPTNARLFMITELDAIAL